MYGCPPAVVAAWLYRGDGVSGDVTLTHAITESETSILQKSPMLPEEGDAGRRNDGSGAECGSTRAPPVTRTQRRQARGDRKKKETKVSESRLLECIFCSLFTAAGRGGADPP